MSRTYKGKQKSRGIDVGLATLGCMQVKHPHFTFTQQEIAEACDVTRQAIYDIERRALLKLRNRVLFTKDADELRAAI